MKSQFFSWQIMNVDEEKCEELRLVVSTDEKFDNIIHDTGLIKYKKNSYETTLKLEDMTIYYWKIWIKTKSKLYESVITNFETGKNEKKWNALWISPDFDEDGEVFLNFNIKKQVKKTRLYITGLGFYEAYLNCKKIGDEYLTPGVNNYDSWIQFQSYKIDNLKVGENELVIMLGSGWYKGRYMSFDPNNDRNRYGERTAALAELYIEYMDGSFEVINTDSKWSSRKSKIRENSIYDGETIDGTFNNITSFPVKIEEYSYEKLKARLSPSVRIMEVKKVKEIIVSEKKELILDFGQNLTGWVKFKNRLKKGVKCSYHCCEILQNGCFYNENLRTAKQEFIYVSDGAEEWIRPHFTYFGFRYVKLEGFGKDVNPDDFIAEVLYSEMEITGCIETENQKVNQLFSNIIWGQKGNFLDVPTDCPQRDERFGWTGDAQVFSMTSAYNMNVGAFFKKFIYDLNTEQLKMNGAVPFIVPNICFPKHVSAAWGDAATIIPWNMYIMYGDKETLRQQYEGMKAWVEFIYEKDKKSGNKRLWTTNAHFGDWLSLDNKNPGLPTGGTDLAFIATAYYYHSVCLVEKAAKTLGLEEDTVKYEKLKEEIKCSFRKEYITPGGRLSIDTQTAYIIVLYFGLCKSTEKSRMIEFLVNKLKSNNYKLDTGFVGTPFLCQVLSENGRNDLAYNLILNEEFPGWLYAVNLGATTIWERWNSVLPDGSMNPDGMNSLNHYAYGSIGEWMYKYMLGIRADENNPGFERFILAPMPNPSIKWVKGYYKSINGVIKSEWKYTEKGNLVYHFEIPENSIARVHIEGKEVFYLEGGVHEIEMEVQNNIDKNFNRETNLPTILKDEKARDIIMKSAPELVFMPDFMKNDSLEKVMVNAFSGRDYLELEALEKELKIINGGVE